MSDSWACFSKNGKYRYSLGRRLSDSPSRLLFIMLNPSKANAYKPDNTITRCINFARDWGYGTMEVVNLFAYITPYRDCLAKVSKPVGGKRTNAEIRSAIESADIVVLAWGDDGAKPAYRRRARRMMKIVCDITQPYHLGLTKKGEPRHPRILRKTTTPTRWKKSEIREYLKSHS